MSVLGLKGLIVPIMRPYSLWNLRNYLSMTKSQLCVKQILNVIWNLTNNKNELWKTVKLTSFQKPQSQSVSIVFKFVHQCPFLYLLCHLHILCIFWAVTLDRIIIRFWETTHLPLPLPQVNINTYFLLGQNVGLREGVGGQFIRFWETASLFVSLVAFPTVWILTNLVTPLL